MTRQETISAAQAFTEKHKESHKIHLENGYIEASIKDLTIKKVSFLVPALDSGTWLKDNRIWAIDQNGVFTTEFQSHDT